MLSVRKLIKNGSVTTLFQPIIDLYAQSILGYEVFTRGVGELTDPEVLFEKAIHQRCLWELEQLCRETAIRKIASLPLKFRNVLFFFNVSPEILSDPRFVQGFTISKLKSMHLDHRRIVIELSEKAGDFESQALEKLIRHYSSQGLKIAIDDFGAGHSSLLSLVTTNPNYIKMSKLLVENIDKDDYKQKIVKSLLAMTTNVEHQVIAQGVETWDEMKTLVRLGVRYFQGYLIQVPSPEPERVELSFRQKALRLVREQSYPRASVGDTIKDLIVPVEQIQVHTVTCEQLDRTFKDNKELDHVVLVQNSVPVGLITRQYFYLETGGPFGYQLFQKKQVDLLAKENPLIVEEYVLITQLANLIMERIPSDVYDPVIVVDREDRTLGTITVKQLLNRSIELEVQNALGANPLTNLPGNRRIQSWIDEVLAKGAFTMVYADLDNFKEYNDVHGFLMGDEMIRFCSAILKRFLTRLGPAARLGHLGGDDFVIVSRNNVDNKILEEICETFDAEKSRYFTDEEIDKGSYTVTDRHGSERDVFLVTLSLSVLGNENFLAAPHPAYLGQIASSIKKKVKKHNKKHGKSGYMVERRTHG